MAERKPGIGKGVLSPKRREGKYQSERYQPSRALSGTLLHFWEVSWSLPPGEGFVQDTVPYPSSHIVLEAGRSEVVGPMTTRFSRTLTGNGCVFGAHVRAGAWAMLSAVPVAQIVDARCPLADVLSLSENEVRALERDVMGLPSAERADRFDAVLSARLRPSEREACMAIANLVEEVEADASIRSAAALATRAGLGLRTLQRRFKERVGLAPKTVILRFRLIEAAERLVRGDASSSELAAELGYADQSHFVRAFRDLIGETPESYAQANR